MQQRIHMNTDLIKQLELALAVERGEMPVNEVQLRTKNTAEKWTNCDRMPAWNFLHYEYRPKPKLLECWVAEYGPGHHKLLWTKDQEYACRPTNCKEPTRMIKMREVTND